MPDGRPGSMPALGPIIATWFVSDAAEDATWFPQVGARSDNAKAQAVYWKCVVCFFASSLKVNQSSRHVFYTNATPPVVEGIDIGECLAKWGVETVSLPVTFRLPRGAVASWGNQFYVFDIMAHHAATQSEQALILLDSDCLWLRPASRIAVEAERSGAVTYQLGNDEHPADSEINGQSREGLARFVAENGGPNLAQVPYCGGEFYAASAATNRVVVEHARRLWPAIAEQGPFAPREEAHLLSAIYAMMQIEIGTGNQFIRRMWTTFHHNNLRASDAGLVIWHLPSEKRTGFSNLFRHLARSGMADPRLAGAMNFDLYCRFMGFPRRAAGKVIADLAGKVLGKLAAMG